MKKNLKSKKILILMILVTLLVSLTGCAFESDSTIASYNVSKEADQFRVYRRIVFVNLRHDTYLLEIQGFCSIDDNSSNELEVICNTGPNEYQKHFLYKANETTYTVEQLDSSRVSKYKYEIVFKPASIIPITIEVE